MQVTRKTSAYNKRLVKAERKKAGHRQGRVYVLQAQGENVVSLVFPEEMKKIRKASKLPVRAVENVGESKVGKSSLADVVTADSEAIERVRAMALQAREIMGLARPGKSHIRVSYASQFCDRGKMAHCHCDKRDAQYGKICISPAFFEYTESERLTMLVHEVLHFKFGRRHIRKFWAAQQTFLPIDEWNSLCVRANARAMELFKK